MNYKILGKTGIKTSIIGFGAMRLPKENVGSEIIDEAEAIRVIRHAIDNGINFIDTAYIYEGSENVVGKALKDGYREKVTLMTKIPTFYLNEASDFDKYLNEQLERLDVNTIDILLFHGLRKIHFEEKYVKFRLYENVSLAKKQGKIRYIGFSSHDTPENVKELLETLLFEVVLLQYNFFDRAYEELFDLAANLSMGTIVMGPLMGGKLAGEVTGTLKEQLTESKKNFADIAFKFVWGNPNVHLALSGLNSIEMVDENIKYASIKPNRLTKEDEQRYDIIVNELKRLAELKCTGCGYCTPCPNEVNIPAIFEALIDCEVYGQKENAQIAYNNLGKPFWSPGKNATFCSECGECLDKCPQNIDIIEQLKHAHKVLSFDNDKNKIEMDGK